MKGNRVCLLLLLQLPSSNSSQKKQEELDILDKQKTFVNTICAELDEIRHSLKNIQSEVKQVLEKPQLLDDQDHLVLMFTVGRIIKYMKQV